MSHGTAPQPGAQYVTLGVDREIFAVEVAKVREILDLRPLTRLPHAPPFMVGMIDVRSQPVAVVDLRTRFGLPAVPPTEHTRIVVLEVRAGQRSLTLGLIADRVFEVTALDANGIAAPPDVGVRWNSDYILGIGRRGDAFVIVFDLDRLFSDGEAALIAEAQ